MIDTRTPGAYVLPFSPSFFLILSSGLIVSLDAGHELQAGGVAIVPRTADHV